VMFAEERSTTGAGRNEDAQPPSKAVTASRQIA